MLLPKAPGRRQFARTHEGRVAVSRSDLRWCSDGLEIKCDSGQTVTATFAKDCCDREVMAWRAWEGKGLPGEPVREMLIEAVERRFGGSGGSPCGPCAGVPERQCSLPTVADNYYAFTTAGPTSRPKRVHWHVRWASSPSTLSSVARRDVMDASLPKGRANAVRAQR